jgi:hypothetical protein
MSGPPHHPRHNVGMAMRAHDHRAVPLCPTCHDSIHRLTCGPFKGWVRDQVRAFLDALGDSLRAEYQRNHEEE